MPSRNNPERPIQYRADEAVNLIDQTTLYCTAGRSGRCDSNFESQQFVQPMLLHSGPGCKFTVASVALIAAADPPVSAAAALR